MQLGKLVEVPVRELWKHEQYNFSNWLASPENIDYLNEILGLNLVDVQLEASVGAYRCDIFAKDDTSDIKVIVENQLEQSDHDHLGKIITYASGLGATYLVWITTQAREEHRSAVEWLNNNTVPEIGFFLLELHAYKIGDSHPAPKFEVIERPNDFIKKPLIVNPDQKERQVLAERKIFWEQLNETLIAQGKPFNVRKATTDHWYDISIGKSGVHLSITLVNKENNVGVEVYINDNKELYDELFLHKSDIETELGFMFVWDRLDTKKASRIKHYFSGLDFADHSNYPELIEEAITKIIKMRQVFLKYINTV